METSSAAAAAAAADFNNKKKKKKNNTVAHTEKKDDKGDDEEDRHHHHHHHSNTANSTTSNGREEKEEDEKEKKSFKQCKKNIMDKISPSISTASSSSSASSTAATATKNDDNPTVSPSHSNIDLSDSASSATALKIDEEETVFVVPEVLRLPGNRITREEVGGRRSERMESSTDDVEAEIEGGDSEPVEGRRNNSVASGVDVEAAGSEYQQGAWVISLFGPNFIVPNISWGRASVATKKFLIAVFCTILICIIILLVILITASVRNAKGKFPRKLIILVGSGAGSQLTSLAKEFRKYSANDPMAGLAMDSYLTSTTSVHSVNPDDPPTLAALATSLSCGIRSNKHFLSMDKDLQFCGTLLEAASSLGIRTGVLTSGSLTSPVSGGMTAHVPNYALHDFIAWSEVVQSPIHLLMGAGLNHFIPMSDPGSTRMDELNLIKYAINIGARTVTTKEEFSDLSSSWRNLPLMAVFEGEQFPYTIDKNSSTPTLLEMTQKALGFYKTSFRDNFFLVIDNPLIDTALKDRDLATALHEIFALEEVFEHLSEITNGTTDSLTIMINPYDTALYHLNANDTELDLGFLKRASNSISYVADKVYAYGKQKKIMSNSVILSHLEKLGLENVSSEDVEAIKTLSGDMAQLKIFLGDLVSEALNITWSPPSSSDQPTGYVFAAGANADEFSAADHYSVDELSNLIAEIASFDLDYITRKLIRYYNSYAYQR